MRRDYQVKVRIDGKPMTIVLSQDEDHDLRLALQSTGMTASAFVRETIALVLASTPHVTLDTAAYDSGMTVPEFVRAIVIARCGGSMLAHYIGEAVAL